ncbi:Protein of unknown function [Enhydrobacter aerosaccus]|uniref:Uncharacterized protein n=1 Tax=Enhydrobacter aerosaccus TaxID=225324 RepID=A0A1T4SK77_9HYPH|nr:copper chaperone PCu(A)C [Enhydrobacter aerosaccus]SKA28563.1 Protein of unknown function [Enhydrobacter aerosaccus]
MIRLCLALTVALALAVPALSAASHEYKLGALDIVEPWACATSSTAQTGGGFLVITSKSTSPHRLISAKSPAADKVENHEMKMDRNVMRIANSTWAWTSRPAPPSS